MPHGDANAAFSMCWQDLHCVANLESDIASRTEKTGETSAALQPARLLQAGFDLYGLAHNVKCAILPALPDCTKSSPSSAPRTGLHLTAEPERKPPRPPPEWHPPICAWGRPCKWLPKGRIPISPKEWDAIVKEATGGNVPESFKNGPKTFRKPHMGEPYEWTPKDIKDAQKQIPNYKIVGPEKYAICFGESGLYGVHSRLIKVVRGVYTMKEAVHQCELEPECTHFSWTAGPELALPYEPRQGLPHRVDLCRGSMVSIGDYPHMNSFVGIKRGKLSDQKPKVPDGYARHRNGPISLKRPRLAGLIVPVAKLPPLPHKTRESCSQRTTWQDFF